jgi:serine protease inhibitor
LLGDLDPDVQFEIANSIWYRLGYTFKQDFVERNQIYFNALVQGLNFADPGASATINGWVNENTGGKILDIVPEVIDPQTVMFLINAIYFKGIWTYEFDPEDTVDDLFTVPDGSSKPCRMMNQEGKFRYFVGSGFQAVDLPYGNGDFTMVVLLPTAESKIESLIEDLDAGSWLEWLGSFEEKEGRLQLPKFRLEYEATLNQVLTAMGMGIAFDADAADFSGMYDGAERLYISGVKHKTFVNVDEEGTEAAGVTSVEVGATSTGVDMRVDHPFVFALRDSHTQTILFIGKIVEPMLE